MLKKLFSLLLIVTGVTAMAQNKPHVISHQVDTICAYTYNQLVLTVVIEDLDGDSTFFIDASANDTYMYNYVVEPPATFSGETQRTFKLYADAGYNFAVQGLNLASVLLEVEGDAVNDMGTLDTSLNDLAIYSDDLGVTVDWGTDVFCTGDNPVEMTPYTSHPGGTTVHGTNQDYIMENGFSPYDFYYDTGDAFEYHWTNDFGCTQVVYPTWPTVYESPYVGVSTNNSTCGNADGSADAFISGQTATFDVFWSTGFAEQGVSSISSIANVPAGAWYVIVTDAHGCETKTPAFISDVEVDVTETITDETCPGANDGEIDLTITGGGTIDEIFWSNGQLVEDATNLGSGEHTVQIHTNTGCQAYYSYYVYSPAPIEVELYGISNPDCSIGLTTSNIDIYTYGGSGDFTWNWDSGMAGTEDFSNPGVGYHTCHIVDNVTGCTFDYAANVLDVGAPYLWMDGYKNAHCGSNDGEIDMYVAVNYDPIASINWSNGASTEDITGIGAGTYTITVTDINGCYNQETVVIENKKPYQPSICLLTVDTSFTYNQIIWEKDVTQNIEGFRVYRETQSQGAFQMVAERPYALESYYMDNIASPMDRSWRYYITTYDACGNESNPSFIHKTIHTVAVPGTGSDYEVYWDDYEGINYSSVDVHRYDAVNGWQIIGNHGPATNHMTDQPTITTDLDYIVTFNLSNTCTTSKAQDYNSSRSNNINGIFDPGNTTLQIEDEQLGEIAIYPNPTNGALNIYVENPDLFEFVEVRDINGNIIYNELLLSGNMEMNLSELANGVYFVRLISEKNIINHKIIKQ